MAARLEVPRGEESKRELFLAHFTHGSLVKKDGVKFSIEDAETLPKKKKKRKLIAESNRLTYAGHNYGDAVGPTDDDCKYMVAVYDEKSKKAKLYPATMFYLKPQINKEENVEKEDTAHNLTISEKLDNLTSAFGSTKKKRAMESRKKNKIETSALEEAVGSAAKVALQNVDVTSLQPTAMDSTPSAGEMASALPPCNTEAEKPQDVYKLHDIIPPNVMTALKTPAQELVNADRETKSKWAQEKTLPGYLNYKLITLPVETEARMHQACILIYIKYMITLFNMKANEIRKIDSKLKEMDVPIIVKNLLLAQFTLQAKDAQGRTHCSMPSRFKDKCVTYALALALILEDFSLEYSSLQADLKLGPMKIVQYIRSLGCNISKTSVDMGPGMEKTSVQLANLTLPLKFPDLKKRTPKDRK